MLNGTAQPGTFDSRLVFIGTTALGTREVVATPLDTLFAGVEVQATVADNLILGAYTRWRNRAEVERDLDEVYRRFPQLTDRRRQLAGTLSGGERQMLALGRALMALSAVPVPQFTVSLMPSAALIVSLPGPPL